jgi:hypothetical protein
MMNEREKNPFLHLKDHPRYKFVQEVEVIPPAHVPLTSASGSHMHAVAKAQNRQVNRHLDRHIDRRTVTRRHTRRLLTGRQEEGACRRMCTGARNRGS